eukprot:TRINITY_DN15196_c0_g1_i1.p1 TRINITY_DN15196_c0_g1~~TRINITY_DN15196_c0_g1_i1.p1  ORF type:complete len:795 (+),score=127.49 TRINITY_DN15196_c0_g1_i1:331-2385(+)
MDNCVPTARCPTVFEYAILHRNTAMLTLLFSRTKTAEDPRSIAANFFRCSDVNALQFVDTVLQGLQWPLLEVSPSMFLSCAAARDYEECLNVVRYPRLVEIVGERHCEQFLCSLLKRGFLDLAEEAFTLFQAVISANLQSFARLATEICHLDLPQFLRYCQSDGDPKSTGLLLRYKNTIGPKVLREMPQLGVPYSWGHLECVYNLEDVELAQLMLSHWTAGIPSIEPIRNAMFGKPVLTDAQFRIAQMVFEHDPDYGRFVGSGMAGNISALKFAIRLRPEYFRENADTPWLLSASRWVWPMLLAAGVDANACMGEPPRTALVLPNLSAEDAQVLLPATDLRLRNSMRSACECFYQASSDVQLVLIQGGVPFSEIAKSCKNASALRLVMSYPNEQAWQLIKNKRFHNESFLEYVLAEHIPSAEKLEFLINVLGVDIALPLCKGKTALMLPMRTRTWRQITGPRRNVRTTAIEETDRLLIDNATSAQLNVQCSRGRTALHYGCWTGAPQVVLRMLKRGADPNIQDCLGETPLHCAVKHFRAEVVSDLLHFGANPCTRSKYGITPLAALLRALHRNFDVWCTNSNLLLASRYLLERSPLVVMNRRVGVFVGLLRAKHDAAVSSYRLSKSASQRLVQLFELIDETRRAFWPQVFLPLQHGITQALPSGVLPDGVMFPGDLVMHILQLV